jgi:hypothetical protein
MFFPQSRRYSQLEETPDLKLDFCGSYSRSSMQDVDKVAEKDKVLNV